MNSEQNTLIFCAIVVYLLMITSFTYSWHKKNKLRGKIFIFFYYLLSPITWVFSLDELSPKKIFTLLGGIFAMAVLLSPIYAEGIGKQNIVWFVSISDVFFIIACSIGLLMTFDLIIYGFICLIIKFVTNYSGKN